MIEPYPERRTYLGYYAEGNPEVSDWEIKWQSEHGIDFQLWCWYPADAYRGGPVRVLPITEQAMHYGYFNAKYRSKLKFALNYNGNPLSTEEFRKNIVPFWIEYYFTNENYVVIDNKPVYNSLGILGETPEESKANVDYIDEQCRLAGFDGAIYIGSCANQQAHLVQGVKDAGAEVIANYGWGYTCCIEGEQENWMTQQRLADVVPVIPTISMGYNNDAWATSGRGGFTTPEMFRNLLLWAKNEHMVNYGADTLASKMVLLDNWNEYGEGHYIMPAGIYGFGYLQAVREVFTENGDYTPERPTNQSLLRMQELYPKGRKALKTVKAAPKFPSKVLKGWYFDKPEDASLWKCKSGIDNFRAEDGMLKGDANCAEPVLYLDGDFSFDMTACPYIRVTERLSNAERMHFFLRGRNNKGEREEIHHYISIKGNIALWDGKKEEYICYIRGYHNNEEGKLVRDIRYMTSKDFKNWSSPEFVEFNSDVEFQLYTNTISPYYRAEGVYVGFPVRYTERTVWTENFDELCNAANRKVLVEKEEPRSGLALTDALFMSSHDGKKWHRFDEAFIDAGPERKYNWIYGDCYFGKGLIETLVDEEDSEETELSLFCNDGHHSMRPTRLYRYTIRKDGFACYRAPYSGGDVVTKPFIYEGGGLEINFATSAGGYMRISILDEKGEKFEGCETCDIIGNSTARKVKIANTEKLKGKAVRLKFEMRDSAIYSFIIR